MQEERSPRTRGSDSAFFFWLCVTVLRAGGSARARGRRVNVDSVVDFVVYMYILLCFPVLTVGFVVSVGLLFSKPRRGLLREIVNLAFAI